MRLSILPRYLVGSREAILTIAASRWSLAVGVLLVLSASLARNYDGAYLVGEWRVLLHGFGASIGNSLLLFGLMWLAVRFRKGTAPPFRSGYLSFLGLFMMTAPMAWLYAVPYERFLTPVEAIEANAWTLALVSLWRVGLMVRVLTVLFAAPVAPVLMLVLLFADGVAFAAVNLKPGPLIDFMGGMQHTPEDRLLMELNIGALFWSFVLAPVCLLAALIGLKWLRGKWSVQTVATPPPVGLLVFAGVALIAWTPVLLVTQPEQQRRFHIERLFHTGQIAEGLAMMSSLERRQLPPVWDPPPRLGYVRDRPSLQAVLSAISSTAPAPWVRAVYVDKAWRRVAAFGFRGDGPSEIVESLAQWPDHTLLDQFGSALRFLTEHDARLTERHRAQILEILERPKPSQDSGT